MNVKRGSKRDPAWAMIGPKAKRTTFFSSKRTYRQAMLVRSRNLYYRLSNQYVIARLHVHAGAPTKATTAKALKWAERYYARRGPSHTNPKKKVRVHTKRAFVKRIKTLRQFNKTARRNNTACLHR